MVLEMQVEVDGQWGPYLECNPKNASNPYGEWYCLDGIKPAIPPDSPPQCKHLE